MSDTLQAGDDCAMNLLSCRQCHADLTRLPKRAKFCPRCGVQFIDEDPLPVPVEPTFAKIDVSTIDSWLSETRPESGDYFTPDSGHSGWHDLPVESIPRGTVTPTTLDPLPPSPEAMLQQVEEWRQLRESLQAHNPGDLHQHDSDVLRGFANAMFHLGHRYETGLGAGRNVDEAIRCYFKSARLGNVGAISRLTPQCAWSAINPTTYEERSNSLPDQSHH